MSPGMSAASDVCLCVEGSGLWRWTCMQGLQKQRGYQIQTWAALLGLTNEELLCLRQRNLQHPPFIYTGGRVCEWVCVSGHAEVLCVLCVCACENGVVFKESAQCVWQRWVTTTIQVNQSGGALTLETVLTVAQKHTSTCFILISSRCGSKWCEAVRDFGSEHISPEACENLPTVPSGTMKFTLNWRWKSTNLYCMWKEVIYGISSSCCAF